MQHHTAVSEQLATIILIIILLLIITTTTVMKIGIHYELCHRHRMGRKLRFHQRKHHINRYSVESSSPVWRGKSNRNSNFHVFDKYFYCLQFYRCKAAQESVSKPLVTQRFFFSRNGDGVAGVL